MIVMQMRPLKVSCPFAILFSKNSIEIQSFQYLSFLHKSSFSNWNVSLQLLSIQSNKKIWNGALLDKLFSKNYFTSWWLGWVAGNSENKSNSDSWVSYWKKLRSLKFTWSVLGLYFAINWNWLRSNNGNTTNELSAIWHRHKSEKRQIISKHFQCAMSKTVKLHLNPLFW